jgi:hypothetical protein
VIDSPAESWERVRPSRFALLLEGCLVGLLLGLLLVVWPPAKFTEFRPAAPGPRADLR